MKGKIHSQSEKRTILTINGYFRIDTTAHKEVWVKPNGNNLDRIVLRSDSERSFRLLCEKNGIVLQ